MKLAKFFQLVNVLMVSSFLFPSFLVISQKAYAENTNTKVFECIESGREFYDAVNNSRYPTIFMNNDEYGVVKIIEWKNKDFLLDESRKPKVSSDLVEYSPQKRCEMVAERFNDFYECKVINNLIHKTVTVHKTEYPAIFVTLSENKTKTNKIERAVQRKCLEQTNRRPIKNHGNNELYLLFMLSKDDQRDIDHEFCKIRGLLNGESILIDKSDQSYSGNLKKNTEPKIADIKFCAENIFFPKNDETEFP